MLTVERGLRVLRAFRSDRVPLSNADLVRRTGLSKATVSRLTSTLLNLGLIRRVPDGRKLELSAGPLAVGHAYLATNELVQVAHPVMQSLADALDVSVAFGIRDGMDMLYVGYRVSAKVATLRLGVGTVLPMGVTAMGHAYLWALPPAERDHLLQQILHAAAGNAARTEKSIRNSFAQLDETGVCGVVSEYQRKVYALAAPASIGRKHTLMGLSCGNADFSQSFSKAKKRIVPELKQAVVQLETLLADYDGPP